MKALTVSALVCAVMILTTATAVPEENTGSGDDQTAKSDLVKRTVSCHGGWYHGYCFHYISTPKTWAKAEKYCVSIGGNLASIHNILEYHEIQRLVPTSSRQFTMTWIGGSDAQQHGQWLWSDGTPFQYSYWCRGEPNYYHGKESCLQLKFGAHNCWNDFQCNNRAPFVCATRSRRFHG